MIDHQVDEIAESRVRHQFEVPTIKAKQLMAIACIHFARGVSEQKLDTGIVISNYRVISLYGHNVFAISNPEYSVFVFEEVAHYMSIGWQRHSLQSIASRSHQSIVGDDPDASITGTRKRLDQDMRIARNTDRDKSIVGVVKESRGTGDPHPIIIVSH